MQLRLDTDAPTHRREEAPDKGHHGSLSGPEGVARRVEKEKIEGSQSGLVEMLGTVPMPSDADRCTAISMRSGKRCKRYRQEGSSVCSKHASSVEQSTRSGLNPRESGLDTRAAERAAAIQTLDEIIDSKKSLASDRIRAVEAKQRILAKQEEEAREERYGPLVALKEALDLIPAEERVAALGDLLRFT